MLIVRFKGNVASSCIACTNPDKLIVGQLYEVSDMQISGGLKLYELNGIEGVFLSSWFSRIAESYDTFETRIWQRTSDCSEEEWHRVY